MTRKRKDAITQAEASPAEARLDRRLEAAKDALARIESGQAPTPEELAASPRLDFWCVVLDGPLPLLQGAVTGHPRLPDGCLIDTSPVLWISEDQTAARTVSRFYRLGVRLGDAMTRQS